MYSIKINKIIAVCLLICLLLIAELNGSGLYGIDEKSEKHPAKDMESNVLLTKEIEVSPEAYYGNPVGYIRPGKLRAFSKTGENAAVHMAILVFLTLFTGYRIKLMQKRNKRIHPIITFLHDMDGMK